jgi:hypothetical protein
MPALPFGEITIKIRYNFKEIPVQAWTDHEGLSRFRLQDFKKIGI